MNNRKKIYENILDKLNEEQKEAVTKPLEWCTKIVAGAGTGKTEIISRRFTKIVLDLYDKKVSKPANRVLVITFTDKAANNMKERIVKTLKQFDIPVINSDLWISTFHSFCSKTLMKHSLEVNLSPDCQLADDQTQTEIYKSIINKIVYNEAKYIENLDIVASELKISKSILDIKNLQLLNKISDPEQVFSDIHFIIKKIKSLGLTPNEFYWKTKQSTEEFGNTVKTIPFKFIDKEGYINGWEIHLKPYIDISTVLTEDMFNEICKSKLILAKNRSSKAETWGYATGFPENIDKIAELEEYLNKLIALVYALYQSHLVKNDLIDYDDQINYTINILKNNDSLKKYYQNTFKHIIIDEFQDTSGSQLELVKLLLNPENPNITFVGDRKQSIYSFRFAQMENLEVLHRDIENQFQKKYDEVKLKTNYRSTPHVLKPVNALTNDFMHLDEQLSPNLEKEFDTSNKDVKLTRIIFDSKIGEGRINEAKYIATEIHRLKKENNKLHYKDFAVLVPKHARAEIVEKYLKESGIPTIKKQNINYFKEPVVKNLIALFVLVNNPRDEVAFVRVLEIQLSQQKLYELKKAIYQLIPQESEMIYNTNFVDKVIYLRENNLFDNLIITENNKLYLLDLVELILKLSSEANNMTLLQLFYSLINSIEVYKELTEIDSYKAEENLSIFKKLIADYIQSDNYQGLTGFLEALDAYQQDKNFELPSLTTKEIDAVQILTIHASKGLEFPYVFVTSLNTGKGKASGLVDFDLQYGNKPGFGIVINKYRGNDTPKKIIYKELWKKPRELAEDIRLFYVSISRAEKYLNIINLIDPAKNKNVPEYTAEILPFDQVQELKPEEIEYTKNKLKPQSIFKSQEKNLLKPEKIFIKEKSEPLILSFTKINAFNHCTNLYLLKYVYRFPEVKEKNHSTGIGSIVHNLVYNTLISGKLYTDNDLYILFEGQEVDISRVIALYNSYKRTKFIPDLLKYDFYAERKFNYKEIINDTQIEIRGDIDLIVKNDNKTYSVIDFKTNKEIEKSLNDYYKQLIVYKKGLESEGLRVNTLGLINLAENGFKEFYPDQEMLIESENALAENLRSIVEFENNSTIKPVQNKKQCYHCRYKYMC